MDGERKRGGWAFVGGWKEISMRGGKWVDKEAGGKDFNGSKSNRLS